MKTIIAAIFATSFAMPASAGNMYEGMLRGLMESQGRGEEYERTRPRQREPVYRPSGTGYLVGQRPATSIQGEPILRCTYDYNGSSFDRGYKHTCPMSVPIR